MSFIRDRTCWTLNWFLDISVVTSVVPSLAELKKPLELSSRPMEDYWMASGAPDVDLTHPGTRSDAMVAAVSAISCKETEKAGATSNTEFCLQLFYQLQQIPTSNLWTRCKLMMTNNGDDERQMRDDSEMRDKWEMIQRWSPFSWSKNIDIIIPCHSRSCIHLWRDSRAALVWAWANATVQFPTKTLCLSDDTWVKTCINWPILASMPWTCMKFIMKLLDTFITCFTCL